MAHSRALGKLFFPLAARNDATKALLRTTIAITQLEGSKASNVLPSRVRAILNVRLLSPWTVDSALEYLRNNISDKRVLVRESPERAANDPVSCSKESANGIAAGWKLICDALSVSHPGVPVLPFLNTATTDSRYYAGLCDSVYRFAPIILDSKELSRIHSHDERISLENISRGFVFYSSLLKYLMASH
jgi:carboxypeptidase PM20D1